MTRRALVPLVAVLVLTGCSSPPTAPTAAGATSAPGGARSSTAPVPSVAPSPTIHRFGEAIPLGNIAIATAYAYRQPVATTAPKPDQPGYEWGAADIKVCAGSGAGDSQQGITVTRGPWSLVYADATQAQPSNTGYNAFPKPEYPWDDHPLPWTRCIRGWIVFPVPAGKRPTMVEYAPPPDPARPTMVIDWAIT